MAKDATYQLNIYKKDGGNTLVIAGGTVESANGQAAKIDDVDAGAETASAAANAAAINKILAVLRDLGMIAPSS